MATGKDGFEALTIGRRVSFSKTISESDVYLFAGITGDLSPNHVDEEYMRKTRYGRRIAHGALALGLMSNTSTKILEGLPGTWISYGYDKVRFPAPLFIGDTVTVDYEIVERDPAQRKTFARVTCTTQRGEGGPRAQRPRGHPRPLLHPVPARAVGRPVPRRHGRRRGQDRAARRNALGAALVGRQPLPQRRQRLLPPGAQEPAQPDARLEEPRGHGRRAASRRERGRAGAELPSGSHGAAWAGLERRLQDQPAAHLRLGVGLRRVEPVPRQAGSGPAGAGGAQ